MEERVGQMEAEGRVLEAARLRQRTTFDLEMMRELGYCSGVENYSRHLSRRAAGSRPWTLLDYFPPDWLLVVDESHMSIPQVVGMYKNDRTRKEILVDFGFRLPSALDNRPLTFEEFESTRPPGDLHERDARARTSSSAASGSSSSSSGPTGVVDPAISVRPDRGPDRRPPRGDPRPGRAAASGSIVTTLTKKMAEDLTDYLRELGVKVQYLHCEVDTLERVQILRDLRLGVFDVLVGHQPAARGDRPARGDPRRDPRRRQGRLPAQRLVAHPDDRPGRPQHRRRGRHVRRHDHRVDAGGDRRDGPAARRSRSPTTPSTGSSRRRSSRRSTTSTSGCGRWPRRPRSTGPDRPPGHRPSWRPGARPRSSASWPRWRPR